MIEGSPGWPGCKPPLPPPDPAEVDAAIPDRDIETLLLGTMAWPPTPPVEAWWLAEAVALAVASKVSINLAIECSELRLEILLPSCAWGVESKFSFLV